MPFKLMRVNFKLGWFRIKLFWQAWTWEAFLEEEFMGAKVMVIIIFVVYIPFPLII